VKLKGRNKVSPDFSMSSMTDIVFLLLIFFMLTANSPNALDLLLPKAKGKSTNTQNVSVSINKDLQYFVNDQRINGEYIEIELKKALEGQENPTIILRAEESVAIKEAVNVMDIANTNGYKVILAVRPKYCHY
jgi:biopolymer transport protein ExbD